MRFLSIVFASIIIHVAKGQALNNSKVRFDGFYQTKATIDKKDKDTTYSYLRFYSDGIVINVTSEGKAQDLKKWFNLKMVDLPVGKYEIYEKRISFSTTSMVGTVTYIGKITNKGYLLLKIQSLINGYKGRERYRFVEISGLE